MAEPPVPPRPRVLIVGAGFGGLTLARALRAAPVDVLLVDRHNYHTFQPLLYQVATAGLEPEEIAHAVRAIFQRRKNVRFRLGTVVGIDERSRTARLADGEDLAFDYLVLAAGTTTHYFGIEGAEQHGFPLKSLDEAVALRSHIIKQFERADANPSLIDEGALTFVVVGGGPTGVEMAGALVELFHLVLRKDYPHLPVRRARVLLVEANDHLLASYHPKSQQHARETLEKRGVDVRLDDRVVKVTDTDVTLHSGDVIPTHTLIWAAGVRAHPLADALGLEQTREGRLVVEPDLSLPGRPRIYVIGDMAASRDEAGTLHPQVAPVAIQGAEHVARQIRRRLQGSPGTPGTPFRYKDRGSMATIGRHAAVAELGYGLRASGFIAWLMWLALHLVQLIGFRNRLNVLVNWAWNYFTYDRSARLIMDRAAETTDGASPPDHLPSDHRISLRDTPLQPQP